MLIIHGGFHKTGSTAIQHALKDGRLQGVQYLEDGYRGLARDEMDRGLLAAMRRAAESPVTIASSEATFGSMTDMYRKAAARSAKLASSLDGVDYRVLVFVRPLHDWLESAYVQCIQQGEAPQTQHFVAAYGPLEQLGWTRVLEEIESELGRERLFVLPHHGELDATQSLAGWLGVPLEQGTNDRANVSIPAPETAVMAMANVRLDTRQSKYLRRVLQAADLSASAAEHRSLFDRTLQEQLLRQSDADWKQVSARWMSGPGQREAAEAAWSQSSSGRPRPVVKLGDDPVFQEAVQTVVASLVADAATKDVESVRVASARLLHLLNRSLRIRARRFIRS